MCALCSATEFFQDRFSRGLWARASRDGKRSDSERAVVVFHKRAVTHESAARRVLGGPAHAIGESRQGLAAAVIVMRRMKLDQYRDVTALSDPSGQLDLLVDAWK